MNNEKDIDWSKFNNNCRNCGYESHCGHRLERAVDLREPDNIIRVCDHCRCQNCSDELKEFWKTL